MPFPVTAVRVLLSSPSDLPEAHKAKIQETIHQWNSDYAQTQGVIYLPTDWQTASSSAYGAEPQSFINQQVVEGSDVGIVVFTDRLGTPTEHYPSGTAEEIALLSDAGKRVAILRNNTSRTPVSGSEARDQRGRLEKYLEENQSKGLFHDYDSVEKLGREVLKVLNSEASKFAALPAQASTSPDAGAASGVWPSVVRETYQETDHKGRLKTKHREYLVLTNQTGAPVTNVSYRYENDGEGEARFDLGFAPDNRVGTLAPGGTVRYPIFQVLAAPNSADCVVTWTAPDDTEHETTSTVSVG